MHWNFAIKLVMSISLAYSPCPNDTYIFEAIAMQRLPSAFHYDIHLDDVQALNNDALIKKYDVTKVSFGAYPFIADEYEIIDAGAALGYDCGPLLISKEPIKDESEFINPLKIAIPGKYTTANLLLSIIFPNARGKEEMIFSEIEAAVMSGKTDAGLIIHENRFTYQEKGLHLVLDLGAYWQRRHRLPIPLGCIVVRRSLPLDLKLEIEFQIRKSIQHARNNERLAMPYIAANAQEMDASVVKQHIELYVNEFSITLGDFGRLAVEFLFEKGVKAGILPALKQPIFLGQ